MWPCFSHVHSAMYTGLTRSFLVPPQFLCTHVSDTNLALSHHLVGRPLGVKVCRPVSLCIRVSYRELHLCMPKSLSTGLDLHILKHKVVRPFTKLCSAVKQNISRHPQPKTHCWSTCISSSKAVHLLCTKGRTAYILHSVRLKQT